MKKYITLIALSLVGSWLLAQQDTLSNASRFMTQKGAFIEKAFNEVYKKEGIRICAVTIKNLNENTTQKALYIEMRMPVTVYYAYLDAQEVKDILGVMKKIEADYLPTKPTRDIEVYYTTAEKFTIGATMGLLNAWNIYVSFDRWPGKDRTKFLHKSVLDDLYKAFLTVDGFMR